MIAVDFKTTAGTPVQAILQPDLLPVPAIRAVLTRVGRVYLDDLPTGTLSLADNQPKEHSPRRITDALGETAVMDHSVHREVFNRNDTEPVNDLPGFLVRKVLTTPPDAFVNPGDKFALLRSFRRSLFRLRKFSLRLRQLPFLRAEKPGVLYGFSGGQMRKSRKPDINSDSFFGWWKRGWGGNVARERCIPFPGTRTTKSTCLWIAFRRSMDLDFDASRFGYHKASLFNLASGRRLRKRHAVITANSTETGVAGFFTGLHPSEKRLERKIDPNAHILKYLGVNKSKAGAFILERRQLGVLHIERQGFFPFLVGRLSFLKQPVPQPSTFFKLSVQARSLLSGWIQPVLEVLTHTISFNTKRNSMSSQFSRFLPALKDGAFTRAREV